MEQRPTRDTSRVAQYLPAAPVRPLFGFPTLLLKSPKAMRPSLPASLFLLIPALCASALAFEGPMPKVLADAPGEKGAWRVEVQQAPGRDGKFAQGMGPMTICTTAAEAMSRDRAANAGPKEKPECARKMLEDSADRAVMQVTCSGPDARSIKSTITRLAPRSYEVASEMTGKRHPQPVSMRMKMSYAGACSAQDAPMSLDKQSPACANMPARLAQMDPAKCPAGANNAACVERMTAARTQMQSMCK